MTYIYYTECYKIKININFARVEMNLVINGMFGWRCISDKVLFDICLLAADIRMLLFTQLS